MTRNLFPPIEKYYAMRQEDFENILVAIMDEAPASHLLRIPGVYEAVSEYFNNEILARWYKEHVPTGPMPQFAIPPAQEERSE